MKKRLSYLFQLLFAITLFLGYSVTVNAATYYADDYTAQLYDNTNGNLTAVTTHLEDSWSPGYYYGWIQLVANSSGGAWGISSPIPLIANHTYSMTVNTINIGCGYTILSTVNRIGVGTTLNNAKTSYQNNTNVTEKFSQAVNNSRYLQFVFTPTINSSYIVFPFASTSSCNSAEIHLDNVIIEDLGESGVSQDDINNSLNSQTNELNNSIQNSTNTITGEIDDMEQNIIDSNKETQDVIKDQFETCRPSYNLFDVPSVWSFNRNTNTPTNIPAGTYYITTGEVIKGGTEAPVIIFNNQIVELTSNMNQIITFDTDITSYKYYSNGYSWVGSEGITSTVNNLMISKNGGKYEPYGEEICTNRIDETNDKLDDVNNTSKGIWETLKSIPNLILEGIKGLFVPSKEELQFLIDEFKQTMENKLGAIYQVSDMLIDVFRSIFSPTERNSCITFPEIKDPMFNKLIIEQTDYCFDSLRTDFDFLFTLSDMIISIVCTLAFGNMLYKKYEGFIGGDTSDY